MIAEIIAVGSEMLTPYRQDTNSLYLTAELNALGVTVAFKTIVGDSLQHLTGAANVALSRADIVIFSGGLGPTEDDLTREAVAGALGIKLIRSPDLLVQLTERFAKRNFVMTPNNAKQADILEGAEVLSNINGSAPGHFLLIPRPPTDLTPTSAIGDRRIVILLPGPPPELKPLFAAEVHPRLSAVLPPRHIAKRVLRMALIPESQVDARTSPIYNQYSDVETTILAARGEISLHFQTGAPTLADAQARVDEVAAKIKLEMGDAIFSSSGESLEEIVLQKLGLRHLTLVAAESCTGGLLAQRLTAVPGSSLCFLGGAVVYTNALKTAFADVPAELIEAHGAVSEPVARALAEGIRARSKASISISITGIAGPTPGGGADCEKPVGLTYIGLADDDGTQVKELNLLGDRERIRWWASQHALELVRKTLA